MSKQKQIEDIDDLNLPDFPSHVGFKFVYQEAIDPDYAEKLVDSLN